MSWKEFLKGMKHEISEDRVPDLAATVTYYGVLALFPFVLFLVALATVVITPADAERIVRQLAQLAPGAVTDIVGARIRQLGERQDLTLLGFGAAGALWAASGGVAAVMRALNVAYGVKEGRPFWKVRGIAILTTIVASVLGLAAALVAVAAAPLADRVGGALGVAIGWLRLPVAGLVMMFVWALMYRLLPDVEQRFKLVTPGTVAGVILWILASWGFSRYVSSFGSYDETYGAIAGVIVLLLWMWISSLALLVGAEINAFIEHRSPEGKREGAKRTEDAGEGSSRSAAARSRAAGGNGREPRPTRPPPAPSSSRPGRRPGRLRGIAAMAAGFAAGVLFARREA